MRAQVLHILDDAVVVNSFISMMETVYPGESQYLILLSGDSPQKVDKRDNIVFYQYRSPSLEEYLKEVRSFRHICFHSLSDEVLLLKIHHPSISWIIWGGDLYEKLIQYRGYKLYESFLERYRVKAAGKLIPTFKFCIWDFLRGFRVFYREERLLKRIKYIITDNECDYGVFKRYYPKSPIIYLGTINYYPIEKLIKAEFVNRECIGNAIWVNNSASANGNHISVFERLSSFSDEVKIYCPISYGEAGYRDYLDSEGKRLLGCKFVPLKTFLPVDQYYALFLNANSFIFGHYRQCGVGNILMALYFGGKCFFYKRNPLYKMYLESGFFVFSIEDDLCEEFASIPLSQDARRRNRELVNGIASKKSSLNQIQSVFGKILE